MKWLDRIVAMSIGVGIMGLCVEYSTVDPHETSLFWPLLAVISGCLYFIAQQMEDTNANNQTNRD